MSDIKRTMASNSNSSLEVKVIDDVFMSFLSSLVPPDRINSEVSNLSVIEINGEAICCSYFGFIYEGVNDNVAILDFAQEIAKIYNNYSVVAHLGSTMKMEVCSTPEHRNRFMILKYIFIKEFPHGAYNYFQDNKNNELVVSSLAFDNNFGTPPLVRLSAPPRKNVKIFRIDHGFSLCNAFNLREDDFEKVKANFQNLPDDLMYVETLPIIDQGLRVLCWSSTFPSDKVVEENLVMRGEE